MINGVGTDIIAVHRVENKISSENRFKEGIFTPKEIDYCESKKTKFQVYAGRYAAKEAFFKSLGSGWRHGMKYLDIEIINDLRNLVHLLKSDVSKSHLKWNIILNY